MNDTEILFALLTILSLTVTVLSTTGVYYFGFGVKLLDKMFYPKRCEVRRSEGYYHTALKKALICLCIMIVSSYMVFLLGQNGINCVKMLRGLLEKWICTSDFKILHKNIVEKYRKIYHSFWKGCHICDGSFLGV